MVERLRTYRHLSGQTNLLPEHIFFLRDGVSDSQFGMVLLEELPQIHAAIKLVQDESGCAITPMVTLIVVGKRHHVRFYTTPASDQNLPAGLIVNQTIVAPDQFSFYLQSHDSPIGTARSGHYVVIKNESGYTLAQLQEIVSTLRGEQFTRHLLMIKKNRPTSCASRDPELPRVSRSARQLVTQISFVIDFDVS